MKKQIVIAFFLILGISLMAQDIKTDKVIFKLPSIKLVDMNGKSVNTGELTNNGKPFIISFWATWCKPCIKELTTISEVYQDWQEETGVKLIAVSIDDSRSNAQVKTLVNGKNWEYEVLLDVNSEFKRAMNVNAVPHTFIVNSKGDIVWQHTSFSEGSELELISLIKKLNAGEPINK
jgi:cytochrome c biogenesis protein CcmG, thiol:disulfide interchange protein DsbE